MRPAGGPAGCAMMAVFTPSSTVAPYSFLVKKWFLAGSYTKPPPPAHPVLACVAIASAMSFMIVRNFEI